MAKKKRHTEAEISAKLQQADALAAEGRTQGDIAQALDISIMTYHRWRKSHPQRRQPMATSSADPASYLSGPGRSNRNAELQTENTLLRKLVTDLLLEKMRLLADFDRERSSPKKK